MIRKFSLTGLPLLTRLFFPNLNAENLYGQAIGVASIVLLSAGEPYMRAIDSNLMLLSQNLLALIMLAGSGTEGTSDAGSEQYQMFVSFIVLGTGVPGSLVLLYAVYDPEFEGVLAHRFGLGQLVAGVDDEDDLEGNEQGSETDSKEELSHRHAGSAREQGRERKQIKRQPSRSGVFPSRSRDDFPPSEGREGTKLDESISGDQPLERAAGLRIGAAASSRNMRVMPIEQSKEQLLFCRAIDASEEAEAMALVAAVTAMAAAADAEAAVAAAVAARLEDTILAANDAAVVAVVAAVTAVGAAVAAEKAAVAALRKEQETKELAEEKARDKAEKKTSAAASKREVKAAKLKTKLARKESAKARKGAKKEPTTVSNATSDGDLGEPESQSQGQVQSSSTGVPIPPWAIEQHISSTRGDEGDGYGAGGPMDRYKPPAYQQPMRTKVSAPPPIPPYPRNTLSTHRSPTMENAKAEAESREKITSRLRKLLDQKQAATPDHNQAATPGNQMTEKLAEVQTVQPPMPLPMQPPTFTFAHEPGQPHHHEHGQWQYLCRHNAVLRVGFELDAPVAAAHIDSGNVRYGGVAQGQVVYVVERRRTPSDRLRLKITSANAPAGHTPPPCDGWASEVAENGTVLFKLTTQEEDRADQLHAGLAFEAAVHPTSLRPTASPSSGPGLGPVLLPASLGPMQQYQSGGRGGRGKGGKGGRGIGQAAQSLSSPPPPWVIGVDIGAAFVPPPPLSPPAANEIQAAVQPVWASAGSWIGGPLARPHAQQSPRPPLPPPIPAPALPASLGWLGTSTTSVATPIPLNQMEHSLDAINEEQSPTSPEPGYSLVAIAAASTAEDGGLEPWV
jgi:hypothetical protein